ncbi:MAG: DUF2306 domain-containing protein [Paraglaciecola polaris]|uniref:DUF2306 domain-containing protein n=1 Tax=Paraglaciecola polaris TaxID=222814 RepID=UPI0030028B27
MTYLQLAYFHLVTVIPAFLIGSYLLANQKGTRIHRALGKVYMILMLITALATLFMKAEVGPVLIGHFGYVHLFSLLVLYAVPSAYIAVRKGNIAKHKRSMMLLYVGAILIAGGFTFTPGRMMHDWFFA